MLAIGRALMGQPKVLLLDEPSMGLAPVLVEQNALMALGTAHRGYVLADSAQGLSENETVQKAYLGME